MRSNILYLIGFSLFLWGNLTAQDLKQTRSLADQFYAQGQYEEALYHYQRVAFFTQPETSPETLLRIADCFLEQDEFTRALEYYDHAYFAHTNPKEKQRSLFSKVLTYLKTENYHFALVELLGQDYSDNPDAQQRKDLYLGMAYFGLEQFETAGTHFQAACANKSGKDQIHQLFSNPKNFSKPNPKTALILSIILPGMGQIYSGDPEAGINSLLLTGSFVALVLYLSVRVHPIDAILTGLPWFQRYYQGGFDNAEYAAELARARNRNKILHKALDLIAEGDL